MKDIEERCRVAVVQAEPKLFDRAAGVADVVSTLDRIADEHPSDLIVFPELLIPGYPHGMSFGFAVGERRQAGRHDWKRYCEGSLLVPGPEAEKIGVAVRRAQAWTSFGISERDRVSGTLYNTNIIFSPDGKIDAVHRKLKPTGAERCVWGDAQDHYFTVSETPWGALGTLICWESYMPLARMALYQKGITLYIAPNTNSNPEWQATIQHIALEGRCYVVNCTPYMRRADYPDDLDCPEEVAALPEVVYAGGSCIIDPYGRYVTGPLWGEPGIIYAILDMTEVYAAKWEFDPIGHYARPDVLRLEIDDR